MNFKEWHEKYYPDEPEEILHKMSHAWAAGKVGAIASVIDADDDMPDHMTEIISKKHAYKGIIDNEKDMK